MPRPRANILQYGPRARLEAVSNRPNSRISVNKGTGPRFGWAKHSDLYEIVHPDQDLFPLSQWGQTTPEMLH